MEVMQKVSDKPLARHVKCGGKLEKEWSRTGFQFKGTGWYVTDYAGKKSESKDTKEPKAESKAESKDTKESKAESSSSSDSKSDSTPKATEPKGEKKTAGAPAGGDTK
jgi:predicted nucleic acid-binding Zn ribbon protein